MYIAALWDKLAESLTKAEKAQAEISRRYRQAASQSSRAGIYELSQDVYFQDLVSERNSQINWVQTYSAAIQAADVVRRVGGAQTMTAPKPAPAPRSGDPA